MPIVHEIQGNPLQISTVARPQCQRISNTIKPKCGIPIVSINRHASVLRNTFSVSSPFIREMFIPENCSGKTGTKEMKISCRTSIYARISKIMKIRETSDRSVDRTIPDSGISNNKLIADLWIPITRGKIWRKKKEKKIEQRLKKGFQDDDDDDDAARHYEWKAWHLISRNQIAVTNSVVFTPLNSVYFVNISSLAPISAKGVCCTRSYVRTYVRTSERWHIRDS